jgi:hypothetical protein
MEKGEKARTWSKIVGEGSGPETEATQLFKFKLRYLYMFFI